MSEQLFTGKVQIVKASREEQKRIDAEWAVEAAQWQKLRRKGSGGQGYSALDTHVHQVIRASARRHGWEPVTDMTPLDELIRPTAGNESDEALRARQEHFDAFLGWIFGAKDAPHPSAVMQRLYMLAYQLRPRLIVYMTQADLGLILGNGKAAWSHRLKVAYSGKLRSRSQKRAGASAAYRQAQLGNKNRRRGEQRKRRNNS